MRCMYTVHRFYCMLTMYAVEMWSFGRNIRCRTVAIKMVFIRFIDCNDCSVSTTLFNDPMEQQFCRDVVQSQWHVLDVLSSIRCIQKFAFSTFYREMIYTHNLHINATHAYIIHTSMRYTAMIGFGSGLVARIGPNRRVIKTDPVHPNFSIFTQFWSANTRWNANAVSWLK